MEATVQILSDNRSSKFIDVLCILMVGIGIGCLSMYIFVSHNQTFVTSTQYHKLEAPQKLDSSNTAADIRSPKVSKKSTIYQQF